MLRGELYATTGSGSTAFTPSSTQWSMRSMASRKVPTRAVVVAVGPEVELVDDQVAERRRTPVGGTPAVRVRVANDAVGARVGRHARELTRVRVALVALAAVTDDIELV